jgi:hypothetical protein
MQYPLRLLTVTVTQATIDQLLAFAETVGVPITPETAVVLQTWAKNPLPHVDFFNRASLEQYLTEDQGVPVSLLAPIVSDFRILVPLLVLHLPVTEQVELLERAIEQEGIVLALPVSYTLPLIRSWLAEQLDKYLHSRDPKTTKSFTQYVVTGFRDCPL